VGFQHEAPSTYRGLVPAIGYGFSKEAQTVRPSWMTSQVDRREAPKRKGRGASEFDIHFDLVEVYLSTPIYIGVYLYISWALVHSRTERRTMTGIVMSCKDSSALTEEVATLPINPGMPHTSEEKRHTGGNGEKVKRSRPRGIFVIFVGMVR
jgi:hypothetical protein